MPGPARRARHHCVWRRLRAAGLATVATVMLAPTAAWAQTVESSAPVASDFGAPPPEPSDAAAPEARRDFLWDAPLSPLGPEWALCPPQQLPIVETLNPEPEPGVVYLQSERGELRRQGMSRFEGGVILQRDTQRLSADTLRYYAGTDRPEGGEVDADGVVYNEGEVFLEGEHGRFDLARSRGTLSPVSYFLRDRHSFGSAARADVEGENHLRLRGARYTTCPPGDPSWSLRAGTLRVNRETGQGSATNVLLSFKRVPILYTPYIRFPVSDQRMSGFLYPTIGQSQRSGVEFALPFYWNIAPHRDATLTLNSMSRRGLMLQSELRYLNRRSHGELYLDYLPDDQVHGNDRRQLYLTHRGRPTERWSVAVDYHSVSDSDFLPDFGGGLGGATESLLERTARTTYRADTWTFDARAQDFQTLRGVQPYQRVPQLALYTRRAERPGAINTAVQSELTRFDHPTRSPTGTRGDVTTALSYPLRGLATFLVPRVAVRHTSYAVEYASADDATLTRTVPIASVDAGVFLERDLAWGETPLLQTLEPRMYYLYVPYRDQTALPRFDTGRYDMSFAQLFRDDRFIGPDRVGDANQVTLALTSRLMESNTGVERLSVGLGQIYYFDDRRVQLAAATAPETASRSDLLGNLTARISRGWSAAAEVHWNPEEDRVQLGTARAQYRGEGRRLFKLAYRLRHDQLEQADVVGAWPLGPRWAAVGRWRYSVQDEQTLESFGGFAYEDCCWGLRVVGRRFLTGDGEYDRAVMVELELKGLSSIGRRGLIDTVLQDGILGGR